MREMNWDQMFQQRAVTARAAIDERVKPAFPWEELLTLSIVTLLFLSVVQSIDSAHWVDDMPSLYPIGFSSLLTGYLLSRIRRNGWILQPIALLLGTAIVYLQLIAILPGGSVYVRTDNMLDRMHIWWYAVTNNGISSDPLPFIILTLVLIWIGSYFSSWAIFRWKNPWLGLVPGGTALMWNISFLPGQFSYSFVVFVFAAVLLLMRMHLAHKEAEWERGDVRYPEFISLSVLNATFWVTLLLLGAVWLLPLTNRSNTAAQRWHDFTSPYTERLAPFGRLFVALKAKKPIEVHNLKDVLALQGNISLSGKQAVDISVKLSPEVAAYLRSQSFDQYTSNGWKVNVESNVPLAPGVPTDVTQANPSDARQQVTVHVTVEGGNNATLFSLGQPQTADTPADARLGGDASDVTSLEPAKHLGNGAQYSVTGTVNTASIKQLQDAGTDYPAWVRQRYLALPGDLPRRVASKARQVTANDSTPYDKAASLESYLRSFPIDYEVPPAPPGQDSVDYFLFDAQRGYFDYTASAMAVMLRTLGIPARVATGYVVDPSQKQADADNYHLTESNAFTWPEVYFPGIGWVEFNPTRSQPLIQRPGSAAQTQPGTAPAHGARDPLDFGAIALDPSLAQSGATTPATTQAGDSGDAHRFSLVLPLLLGGALALLVAGGARFAWGLGLHDLPAPAQAWRKTQRLARWSNVGVSESETPREFAGRMQREVGQIEPISYLAAAYERTTFGRKELPEDETERVEASWRAVRNRLLRRLVRRR
ncbi:MAG TPA: transglutaminase domain-containing protein [Dehalococcoidia bacterium]|nr:transglutaminase domain-containing protein [Dehalococcoidia bacterium]